MGIVRYFARNDQLSLETAGERCDGQVKTDIELSHPAQPLEVMGTDIPHIRVPSLAVGEHLEVLDHIIPRFLPRGIVPQGRTLPLDTPAEPLGHGIVYALALAAHTTAEAMFRQQGLLGMTGLLKVIPIKLQVPTGPRKSVMMI